MDDRILDYITSLKAQNEIADLALRYATAADAIGGGDVEEGRRLFRSCFTPDAAIAAFMPDHQPNNPPTWSVTGPDAYTDMVNEGFKRFNCSSTHHQIGNIQVTVEGDTATMKSYVLAFHILEWNEKVDFATASYTDRVVRTADGWRIAHRDLRVKSFLRLLQRDQSALSEVLDVTREITK